MFCVEVEDLVGLGGLSRAAVGRGNESLSCGGGAGRRRRRREGLGWTLDPQLVVRRCVGSRVVFIPSLVGILSPLRARLFVRPSYGRLGGFAVLRGAMALSVVLCARARSAVLRLWRHGCCSARGAWRVAREEWGVGMGAARVWRCLELCLGLPAR